MGAFKYIAKSFESSLKERSTEFKQRLQKWRKANTIARAEGPSNPVRARTLGYKAKKGYVIVRVKIKRGKRARRKADQGRKPGRTVKYRAPGRSLGFYAENKASLRYPNLCVVNSYPVGTDGVFAYFEVILKTPTA